MSAAEPVVDVDGLQIDLGAQTVRHWGEVVQLTPDEFALLGTLARHRGHAVSRRTLLAEVWGPSHVDDVPTLRRCIGGLRHKIEPDGHNGLRFVHTVTDFGYRLGA